VDDNKLVFTRLAFEDRTKVDPKTGAFVVVTHDVPRASLAECTFLFRYEAMKADRTNEKLKGNVRPAPLKTSAEFFAICASLDDLPPGFSEPNLAGRLRHAWSVIGRRADKKGHLQLCLENSTFT